VTARGYDFHGVRLEVAADDERVGAAIDGRLRHFRSTGEAEVVFSYRSDQRPDDLPRPGVEGRRVYDPAAGGDVRYFEPEDALWIDAGPAAALCHAGRGRTTVAHAGAEDLWLLSRPLFTLPLVEVLERRGLHCLHAAGVAIGDRAVLLPGTSGAGKSTLALALARAGLPLLSDDMVFLSPSRETVTVHGFPDEVDVTEETAGWFAGLDEALVRREGPWPKHRLWIEDLPGASIAPDCVPGLLLLPEVSGEPRSRVEPVSAGEALVAITPNVLLTDPAASQAHLDALAALVRASRCHRLLVGRDFDDLPALVRELAEA
jgi:hypothetical protein